MSSEIKEAIGLVKELEKLSRKIESKLDKAEGAFAGDQKLMPAAEAIFSALRKPIIEALSTINKLSSSVTDALNGGMRPVQNLEGIRTFTEGAPAPSRPTAESKRRKDSVWNTPEDIVVKIRNSRNEGKSVPKIKEELENEKHVTLSEYAIRVLSSTKQAESGTGRSWSRKKTSQDTIDAIVAARKEGKSVSEIKEMLKAKNISVSDNTINRYTKPVTGEYKAKRAEAKRSEKLQKEAAQVPEVGRFYTTTAKDQFLPKSFIEDVLAQERGHLSKQLIKKNIYTLGTPKDFSSARSKLVNLLRDANFRVKHGDSAIRYVRRDLATTGVGNAPEEPKAEEVQNSSTVSEMSLVIAKPTATVPAETETEQEPEKPKRELMPNFLTNVEFITQVKHLVKGAGGSIQLFEEKIMAQVFPATDGTPPPQVNEVMAAFAKIFESEGLGCKVGEHEMWVMEK